MTNFQIQINEWLLLREFHEVIKSDKGDLNKFILLKQETIDFLENYGLPKEIGELNFDYLDCPIKTVNERWDLEEEYFDNFLQIGFNGSGDPIAINLLDNESLIFLNHDNNFEHFFISSTVVNFFSLIILIDTFFIKKLILSDSKEIELKFTDKEYDNFINKLKDIDIRVFTEPNSHLLPTIELYKTYQK